MKTFVVISGTVLVIMSDSEERQDTPEKADEEQVGSTEEDRPVSRTSQGKKKKAKPHRGPPSPTPDQLADLEKNFLLDCIAVDTICKDYSHSQPKMGPAIPPYNSQNDKHVKAYFRREAVDVTLRETGQDKGGCSIDGPVIDRFIESGAGYRYLHARNAAPRAAKAGHSADQVDGHGQFMSDARPNFGYHGHFGYRRNTPWLRQMPSPFGVDPRSPTH